MLLPPAPVPHSIPSGDSLRTHFFAGRTGGGIALSSGTIGTPLVPHRSVRPSEHSGYGQKVGTQGLPARDCQCRPAVRDCQCRPAVVMRLLPQLAMMVREQDTQLRVTRPGCGTWQALGPDAIAELLAAYVVRDVGASPRRPLHAHCSARYGQMLWHMQPYLVAPRRAVLQGRAVWQCQCGSLAGNPPLPPCSPPPSLVLPPRACPPATAVAPPPDASAIWPEDDGLHALALIYHTEPAPEGGSQATSPRRARAQSAKVYNGASAAEEVGPDRQMSPRRGLSPARCGHPLD